MAKAKETAWQPLKPRDSVAVVNACMIDGDRGVHAEQYQQLLKGWDYNVPNKSNVLRTYKLFPLPNQLLHLLRSINQCFSNRWFM